MIHLWGILSFCAFVLYHIMSALWFGTMFHQTFCLRPSLNLLDQTQRNSVQLQSLQKLFTINWLAGPLTLICLGWLYFVNTAGVMTNNYLLFASIGLLPSILMIILQAYAFSGPHRQIRRAIRPKETNFSAVYRILKLIILLDILSFVLNYFIIISNSINLIS